MQNSLRFLVLGCGSIGQRHIKNLLSLGAGEVLAFDPLPDRRGMAEEETGVTTTASPKAGWDWNPQVVLVATSTPSHVPLALEAARRGCHVFVEKPLSHRVEGMEPLLEEVARRGLVSMVGCNMRFHPGPAAVKRLLDEGAVGKVLAARIHTGSYLPRWRPWQDYRESYSASVESGGAVLDCIHEVDLALWYLGPAELKAAAVHPARSIGLEADGLAEMILIHESGALSSIHLNFVQRDYRRTCQIIGEEGTLHWNFAEGRVHLYGEDGQIKETLTQPEGWNANQMYVDEMAHFLTAVRSGSVTANPLSGGLEALKIALAAKTRGSGAKT